MKTDIFGFKTSQDYLLFNFGDKSRRKGLKSQAARFMGCHSSVISQLLRGTVQLNLEQADKLNQFLGHAEDESRYFLSMIQKERAGTRSLQNYFQKQMSEILENHLLINKRIGTTVKVSKEDEQLYYSSWLFAAVHVALSIPGLRSAEALSKYLRIPVEQIAQALSHLIKAGLAIKTKSGVEIGPKHIHLDSSSPHITSHHRNWRIKTLQDLETNSSQALHYSSVVTLSQADVNVIKEQIIENLKILNKTIQASKEEEIYVLNFDFFRI